MSEFLCEFTVAMAGEDEWLTQVSLSTAAPLTKVWRDLYDLNLASLSN